MNCKEAKSRLVDLIQNELAPEVAHSVHAHLAQCPTCQKDYAEMQFVLESVRRTQAPSVQIEPAEIYQQAASHAEQQSRHWRRVSCALGLLAASFLIAFLSRNVEVRWTGSDPALTRTVIVEKESADTEQVRKQQEQIHHLMELTQALADEQQRREVEHQQELAELRAHVQETQQESIQWRAQMERQFAGLYQLYLVRKKGDLP